MMRRHIPMKILAGAALAVAVLGAALFGGVIRETYSAPAPAATPVTPAQQAALRDGRAAGDTAELVRRLTAAARAPGADARVYALLGLAYAQRARETGDAAFLSRADGALRNATARDPRNVEALLGQGTLALTRHRFAEALEIGRRLQQIAPESASSLGIVGDALLELGRYPQAFATFDRMVTLKPSVSSYARVGYARELIGDVAGAVAAMELAVDAAGSGPTESAAFARTQLANLLAQKQPTRAAAIYREALLLRPAYTPALIGLGGTEETFGRLESARALYRRALALAPSPDAAVALGDVLKRLGRSHAAAAAYELAHALEEEFARHGGSNELESAMLDLNRDVNLREALRRARKGYALRPSIEGEHVLAWALYKNGRCAEARRHSIRHLRLGTPDTDGLYHRVLIERCLGDERSALQFLRRLREVAPRYLAAGPPSAFRLGS
jgi:tetratricopeptide (TPR) repeat protein